MLIASHLSKHYDTPRGPVLVVEDVSFQVAPGESAAIMGPSGCGKSTLLYMLGALEPPSSGTVTLDGANPYDLKDREQSAFRNRHIGFIFQDHLLLPQLSALDNVLAPTLVSVPGPGVQGPESSVQGPGSGVQARARALLDQVGLSSRIEHRPGELSGGERQRVAIARALICQPSLLLCDEPTGNLDRASAEGVADLLVSLQQSRKTMLVVVTHSAALAARFSRRYELADQHLSAAG